MEEGYHIRYKEDGEWQNAKFETEAAADIFADAIDERDIPFDYHGNVL